MTAHPEAACLRSLVPVELSVCDEARSFLQSGFWGAFKAQFGWISQAFTADWGRDCAHGPAPLLVMSRRLGPFFSFAYVPWGPEADFSPGDRTSSLAEIASALRPLLPGDTAFIRFDPPWRDEEGGPPLPLGKPFTRAAADVQCPDTVLAGLDEDEDAMLARMKPKWRYNIRLAEKKGVQVERAGLEEFGLFYGLLEETARRDGIAIHHRGYYETLFSLAGTYGAAAPDIRLYLARHEGDVLAGIVTLFRKTEAVYLYGASANLKRNLMAPYALQWRAMRDAKSAGCLEYDLFGIPPTDDPGHPMAGLYLFKTGFGGRIIHRPGSWDYPRRPLASGLFRAAESVRKKLRDWKKQLTGFSRGSQK